MTADMTLGADSPPANQVKEQKLLKLKQDVAFSRPRTWQVHVRYALRIGGEKMTLPVGTWLLEQPPAQVWLGEGQAAETEYLYRLPSSELVALPRPLTDEEAESITDPQAITAMAAFCPLDQAAYEDWGVQLEHVDRLPPFALIKCPFCNSTAFTSLGFASVWCDRCGANFRIRYTSGDPGFVVDALWFTGRYGPARYLVPRSDQFSLFMVLKNSGDPRDLTHEDWRQANRAGCTPERLNLTDDSHPSLRPGLHICHIGDLSDWRLSGWVPNRTEYDPRALHYWEVDGERWPQSAYLLVSGLTYEERSEIQVAISSLFRGDDPLLFEETRVRVIDFLTRLMGSWRNVMIGPSASLPPLSALDVAQDQRYMLHHWLTYTTKEEHPPAAYPVWLVVKPILGQPITHGGAPIEGWEVVRRDICPVCCRPVSPEEMMLQVKLGALGIPFDNETSWHLPHGGNCRKVWEKGGWKPYLAAKKTLATEEEPLAMPAKSYWLVARVYSDGETPEDWSPKYAVIELKPYYLEPLFQHLQVALANQCPMSLPDEIGAAFYRYEQPLKIAWADCFTGQTFDQQGGHIFLDEPPRLEESGQTGVKVEPVLYPRLMLLADGGLIWSARVEPGRNRVVTMETDTIRGEGVLHLAKLSGISQRWTEQRHRPAEAMGIH